MISPYQVIAITTVAIIRSIISILGIISIRYIVDEIEINRNFNSVIYTVVIFFLINIFLLAIRTFLEKEIIPINTEKIIGEMKKTVFKKAVALDLECYENIQYYNNLSMAQEQAGTRITEMIDMFSILITSIFSITAFITIITVTKPFIIVISFLNIVISFLANTITIKYKHDFYNEKIPVERIMNYMQKVSSDAKCAIELRLYNDFPRLLLKNIL